LAAARKKKEEEKRTETPTQESAQSDRVVALLDRLSVKKENESPLGSSKNRTKFIPSRQKEQNHQVADASAGIDPMKQAPPPIAEEKQIPVADICAVPSMFAKAICKQPAADESLVTAASCSGHGRQWNSDFSLPYIHNPSFIEMNPFAGPSPDDIVLQAQSKGSLAS
jgi:elongation factor 1 alpha-like protein